MVRSYFAAAAALCFLSLNCAKELGGKRAGGNRPKLLERCTEDLEHAIDKLDFCEWDLDEAGRKTADLEKATHKLEEKIQDLYKELVRAKYDLVGCQRMSPALE
ncbi:hypothetical protein M885DRAFT_563540 [Pelagophyceae sp. CCMP2097]|nr:hypothetical protein M885DRAFT_563540 [Pelagophyceae sp. CCMP2097]